MRYATITFPEGEISKDRPFGKSYLIKIRRCPAIYNNFPISVNIIAYALEIVCEKRLINEHGDPLWLRWLWYEVWKWWKARPIQKSKKIIITEELMQRLSRAAKLKALIGA